MDVANEEKAKFLMITLILGLSESAVVKPGSLSMEIIEQVSTEVERLSKLTANRMKELVMKKRLELDDICVADPCELLANIDIQMNKSKDEVWSRKEIVDKIDRWLAACDEENWLEYYT
ncbi:unnamed protein product [Fraxinus pennsylvanica]|uniref:Uncharacterized protein n=1 Tax=Fraxinus pennsylvanica TaxID=56036 RepID=A0AAD2DG46_9LAMI|nr:unnamed protein product [Fraxinus pennsylvanica]